MKQSVPGRPPGFARTDRVRARVRPGACRAGRKGGTGGNGFVPVMLLLTAFGVLTPGPVEAARPNVLFISIDDMNGWVAPFNEGTRGKPVIATPHLGKLASEGVAFLNAHTPVPLCAPTRASIVTGVYPGRNGKYIVRYSMRDKKFRGIETMTQLFRRHGYLALGGGKIFPPLAEPERHWDVHRPFKRPASQKRGGRAPLSGLALSPRDGFDWGAVEYRYEEMSDVRIAQWAIGVLQEEHDRPFFLGVGFHLPHLPWYLPGRYLDRYPLESVELPEVRDDDLDDVPPEGREIAWKHPRTKEIDYEGSDHAKVLAAGEWKRAVQAYSAANSFVDDLIGRILEALGESRHAHDTIVVVFGDNGWHPRGETAVAQDDPVGGGDADSADPELAVPAASRTDGQVRGQPGRHLPHPAGAGRLPPPDHELDGQSLLPLLADGGESGGRFAMTAWDRATSPSGTRGWRYIRYAKGGRSSTTTKPTPWSTRISSPFRTRIGTRNGWRTSPHHRPIPRRHGTVGEGSRWTRFRARPRCGRLGPAAPGRR